HGAVAALACLTSLKWSVRPRAAVPARRQSLNPLHHPADAQAHGRPPGTTEIGICAAEALGYLGAKVGANGTCSGGRCIVASVPEIPGRPTDVHRRCPRRGRANLPSLAP